MWVRLDLLVLLALAGLKVQWDLRESKVHRVLRELMVVVAR